MNKIYESEVLRWLSSHGRRKTLKRRREQRSSRRSPQRRLSRPRWWSAWWPGHSARSGCCSRGSRRLAVHSVVALAMPSPRSVCRGQSRHCM